MFNFSPISGSLPGSLFEIVFRRRERMLLFRSDTRDIESSSIATAVKKRTRATLILLKRMGHGARDTFLSREFVPATAFILSIEHSTDIDTHNSHFHLSKARSSSFRFLSSERSNLSNIHNIWRALRRARVCVCVRAQVPQNIQIDLHSLLFSAA